MDIEYLFESSNNNSFSVVKALQFNNDHAILTYLFCYHVLACLIVTESIM